MKPSVIIGIVILALLAFAGIGYYFFAPRDNGANDPTVEAAPLPAVPYAGKRVFYVDSYHEGYPWSDTISKVIQDGFAGTGADLRIFHMDTKRNQDETFKSDAAARARADIDAYDPDVLIVSDDNAFRYLVMEYYRDSALPIVFAGLNWDVSPYGAPYTNTTGIIEVNQAEQIIAHLRTHAKGTRIGYLSADTETDRRNHNWYTTTLGIAFERVAFVRTMDEWEVAFKELQNETDAFLFENSAGIEGWDHKRAEAFALAWTKVPVGTTNEWTMKESLIGIVRVPEEQGEWSVAAAKRILDGVPPRAIELGKSKRGKLFINLTLADRIGVVFPANILKTAAIVR